MDVKNGKSIVEKMIERKGFRNLDLEESKKWIGDKTVWKRQCDQRGSEEDEAV